MGVAVSGDDFWPRADVIDELLKDLTDGKGSRRCFSLRRIGKTSVLRELERLLHARDDVTVIRIDVQSLSRFKDFLAKLFEQIPAESRLINARQKFAGNKVIQSILPALWTRLSGAVSPPEAGFQNEFDHNAAWSGDIETALQEAGPIVLIIDELPYMLRNMMREGYKAFDCERFLATLRNWRMNCDVRMLFAGSVGLNQLSRDHGVHVADHMGDVFPVALPPLTRPEAIAMVEALALGEGVAGWSRELSEAIVDQSAETWPIFLQYSFRAVARLKDADRNAARAKSAIDTGVRQALAENFYEQFTTRLSRYGEDQKPARVVLRTIAACWPGLTAFQTVDEALDKIDAVERRDDLLEALREDDFIVFDTEAQTICFASKLVPIWVRARAWGR